MARLLRACVGLLIVVSPCVAAAPATEFEVNGARYALRRDEYFQSSAVYTITLLRPYDRLLPPGGTGVDRDQRCDAFARRLASIFLRADRGEAFVRREVIHHDKDHYAIYLTMHQGYLVENQDVLDIRLDEQNRIIGGSIGLVEKRPPLFRLKSDAELDSIARASVRIPIRDVFARHRLITIQDSIARPEFQVHFLVHHPHAAWVARVDAETGVVLTSEPRFPADYAGPRTW